MEYSAILNDQSPVIARDEHGVAHIVPISGGKDSTCLALALREKEPRPYTYIHTPTGDELPEMMAHMERLGELLNQPIITITNGTLASVINDNKMLPNCHARFCTRILKLRPAGQFYAKIAPVVAYVGLRDDEDEREGTRPGGDSAAINSDVRQDFPFQRWGWDIDSVWSFLEDCGVTIPDRTDCARCPYQKLGEWFNLYKDHPDIYASAEADEERFGHTFRSDKRDTWPASLKGLRERFDGGDIPERSLRMMDKRKGMCRACSL